MDPVDHGSAEIRAAFREQIHSIGHGLALWLGQGRPPLDELIRDLDLSHGSHYES